MASILPSHGGNSIVSRNHDGTTSCHDIILIVNEWGVRDRRVSSFIIFTLLWITCNVTCYVNLSTTSHYMPYANLPCFYGIYIFNVDISSRSYYSEFKYN